MPSQDQEMEMKGLTVASTSQNRDSVMVSASSALLTIFYINITVIAVLYRAAQKKRRPQ